MGRRAIMALAAAAALAACGAEEERPARQTDSDPGLVHIHGLGVNPRDGALYIATHTGLFRADEGEREARRVGRRRQDTMGFTVVGPDHFLGSGHPDVRDDLPPFLGLIESRDAGRSWKPVSLLGSTDFHVLEALDDHVYGFGSDFESRTARFLVSADGGKHWRRRSVPEPLISLAIDPRDARHVVASGESQLFASRDSGRTWRPLASGPGLLAWDEPDALQLVGRDGTAARSADGGRSWIPGGSVAGQPAAFEAAGDSLYVALHDGTVHRSGDGGRTWAPQVSP